MNTRKFHDEHMSYETLIQKIRKTKLKRFILIIQQYIKSTYFQK